MSKKVFLILNVLPQFLNENNYSIGLHGQEIESFGFMILSTHTCEPDMKMNLDLIILTSTHTFEQETIILRKLDQLANFRLLSIDLISSKLSVTI